MSDSVEPNSSAADDIQDPTLTGSEAQLRALFNRLPIGFYESTLDGRLLLVNQHLVKLLGYPSRDELMQRRISDLYYNYDLLMPQIMLTLQREQRMESVDMRLLRYDGSIVWALVELTLMRDASGAYRVQAVVSDVTPRKLSERALRESEDRYQTVVMALMEGVVICDSSDIITTCNPRAEQILGQPSVQLIGKRPLQNLEAFREDGTELPYEEYPSFIALRTGQPCLNVHIRLHRLDGSEVWIAVNSQPLFYPGEDQPYSVVSSFQDITQRERQMQVLRVINAIASAATEMSDEWTFINQAEEWMREIFTQVNLDLLLIDEQKGTLTNSRRDREFQFGKGLAGMVALDGLFRNIQIEPEERSFYSPIYADSHSELCTPLKIEGLTIGVLNLESSLPDAFGVRTEEMARALAAQVASVLMKMRSLEAEHQRLEQLETVVNVSRALRRSQNTPEIIQILVDRCVDVLGASSMALILEHNGRLREVYLHNIDPSFIGTEIPYDSDDAYWQVMEKRQMSFLPTEYLPAEKERNPLLNEILAHSNWSVLMPLKATHVMLGLMHIAFNDHRNHLNRAEREILTAITEIAGISLNRAQIIDTLEQRVNERTRSLQALYNIRRISSELHEVPEMLNLSLDEILKAMDTDAGGIYLVETSARSERRLVLQVCKGVSTQVIQDLRQLEYESQIYWQDWILHDPRIMQVKDLLERPLAPQAVRESGLRHFVAVPMRLNNQLLGVLVVLHRKPSAFMPEEIALLESVAHQVADALEAVRLRKQAQEGAVVQERQRLARELHDSVTQALYSMNLIVNAARRFAENGNMDRAIHYLNQLPDISQQALKEMRLLIYDLRPSALEEEGLYFALSQRLETVERRAGVNATLTCPPTLQLPRDIEEGLYRITIEALSNILKHASASQASVRIEDGQESVQLEVEDNGKGFDPTRGVLREGFGLKSMRERAEQLGGSFQIFSQPGSGTLVRTIIPLQPPPPGTQPMPENLNSGNLNY